jgi:plastocyanin
VRPLRVISALGLALSLVSHVLAADPPVKQTFGTIKGKLVWGGASVPVRPPLIKKGDTKAKDSAVCAVGDLPDRSLVVDPKSKGVAFGVAYLPKPSGANADAVKAMVEASPKVVLDQKNCEFLPHLVAVHEDQKVILKSSDPVLHNVRYSGFANTPQNLALAPNGSFEASLKADRPMELKCDVHPWMSGWVLVYNHPFFSVTDAEGNFEIKGVPPGEQSLVVWQEKVGFVTPGRAKGIPITVTAGEVTVVPDIVLQPSQLRDAKPAGN